MITQDQLIDDIRKPVYGSGKGMMWIADDFDSPLEELKEYMQNSFIAEVFYGTGNNQKSE